MISKLIKGQRTFRKKTLSPQEYNPYFLNANAEYVLVQLQNAN